MSKKVYLTEAQLQSIVERAVMKFVNEMHISPEELGPACTAYWRWKHPEWSEEMCDKAAEQFFRKRNPWLYTNGVRNKEENDTIFGVCTPEHWKAKHPDWSLERCTRKAKIEAERLYGQEYVKKYF